MNLVKLDPKIEVRKRAKEYGDMIKSVSADLPMIRDAISHFGKGQSQFMDNFLTVSHPTPLRNARQILAEMNKSIEALKEAQYKMAKKELQIERLERELDAELETGIRDIVIKELQLEIEFERGNLDTTMLYVEGAIRAVTNYSSQYKAIMGDKEMSEIDFEREEEQYHIMKAFEQALCAARSRGGLIDEGNHIYFSQIGVNGGMAQHCITKYLEIEQAGIQSGKIPSIKFKNDFLKDMANKFTGCSRLVAIEKGMLTLNESAILK